MGVISQNGIDYPVPSVPVQSDAHATDLTNAAVPTGQTIKSYLNSNFATKKYYANYISAAICNANTNIVLPTNEAITFNSSNFTFNFNTSGVYILIFHIAVKDNGTAGRSWLKFINNADSNTLVSSIHYGEYATHDFVFVGSIASSQIFRLTTVENIIINSGGIGPSYMEIIRISS